MARPTKSGARSVAIELLECDHRKVEALFKRYEEAKEEGKAAKREAAEQVCDELTVHMHVEEDIFYPWLRDNLSDDDMDLVEEAEVEHATAKDLIGQIEDAVNPDEAYDAKVKVLSEYIKHHVKEEEEELFPKLGEFKEELDALGQQMHARKAELRAELGITEEDEEPMPAGAMAKAGKAGAKGSARGAKRA